MFNIIYAEPQLYLGREQIYKLSWGSNYLPCNGPQMTTTDNHTWTLKVVTRLYLITCKGNDMLLKRGISNPNAMANCVLVFVFPTHPTHTTSERIFQRGCTTQQRNLSRSLHPSRNITIRQAFRFLQVNLNGQGRLTKYVSLENRKELFIVG